MNTYNKLNNVITALLSLIIAGCSSTNINVFSKLSGFRCPLKTTAVLLKENVKEIDLEAENLISSSQININQNIGYVFKVRSGQKLNYKTNKNTCLWVFTPENVLVNSSRNKTVSNLELSESGTYVVQISTSTSFLNFDLDLNLGFSRKEAVSLLENWYQSKEKVLGKTFDSNVLSQYTTGDYQTKTNKTVARIRKTKCYYKFNQTTIEDIVHFDNIPQRPVLVVKVYEDYERYSTSIGSKCEANSPYRATITYWFEKDNGVWKIYNYKLKEDK